MFIIKKCPKCNSENFRVNKNGKGFKCNDCGLKLGPFEREDTLEKAVKLWRKKSKKSGEKHE